MNSGVAYLALLALAAVGVILWQRGAFWRREAKGWSAGPIIEGKNHSKGVRVSGAGFAFPVGEDGIHYFTKACGPITKPISLRFRVDAEPDVRFLNDYGTPATVTLYVEREGNDWSARNQHERIYGPTIPLTAGDHVLESTSWQDWSGVLGDTVTTEADVADVMRNAKRVGAVFGGGSGDGHGAYATGPARFEVLGLNA